jgi:hypothetical protein
MNVWRGAKHEWGGEWEEDSRLWRVNGKVNGPKRGGASTPKAPGQQYQE